MKKLFLIIPVIVLLFSCGSAPETTGESPAKETVVSLSDAKARATSALDKAKSIKADVAVKDDFNKAMQAYTQAEGLAEADAVKKYLEAEGLFTGAYDKAKALRDAALDQLNKAKTEIKTAENEAAAFEQERAADTAAQGAQ